MTTISALEKRTIALDKKIEVGFANLSVLIDRSIESLAISIKNNFDRIDERFEQVDRQFEQVDERFDQMDKRFDRIENVSMGGHERRIENLEDDVRIVKTKIGLRK